MGESVGVLFTIGQLPPIVPFLIPALDMTPTILMTMPDTYLFSE